MQELADIRYLPSQLNHPKLTNLSWPLLHHLVVTNAKQRFVLFYGHDPSPVRPVYQKKGSGGSSRKGEPKPDLAASELSLISLEAPAAPIYDSECAASGSNASAPIESTSLGEGGVVIEAEWFIRAAQGHSLPTVTTEHLDPVSNDDEGRSKVGEMVHGTKEQLWDIIREYRDRYNTVKTPAIQCLTPVNALASQVRLGCRE